jgi:hypothetical protein
LGDTEACAGTFGVRADAWVQRWPNWWDRRAASSTTTAAEPSKWRKPNAGDWISNPILDHQKNKLLLLVFHQKINSAGSPSFEGFAFYVRVAARLVGFPMEIQPPNPRWGIYRLWLFP